MSIFKYAKPVAAKFMAAPIFFSVVFGTGDTVAGTIEEISAKQLDNFNDQLGIQKKRAEDAAIALGDVLMPAAKELLEVTGEGITAFQDWAKALEENEEFVDKMATGAERPTGWAAEVR